MAADSNTRNSDIDARMAQILGQPPRIEPIPLEKLSEDQAALIKRIRSSVDATPDAIPEFFLVAVKHPALFRCQLETGTTLFKGAISPRDRELAVLRVGWLCRAPYEWGEHVDIAKRFGITREEIERVTHGSTAEGWSEHDAAVLRGVEELLEDKMISDETWNTLAKTWTELQLMEYPVLVGAYVSTAFQQNALRLRLAPDNPGLRYR